MDSEYSFKCMIENLDFHRPSRSEWKAMCYGQERAPMQEWLLQIAEAAHAGSRSDRLVLYKAAHAVLPLHGSDLLELARLFIESDNSVSLEWCDVLVDALSENKHMNRLSGDILEALHISIREADSRDPRIRVILRQVQSLGFNPQWLLDMADDE